jgi:diguanylate cyclase (GGDEF)-like protein
MTPSLALATCSSTAWQFTPDLPLRLALIAGLLMVAGWAVAQRWFAGRRLFLALVPVMALWVGFTTAEHAAVDPGCKTTLALLGWPSILLQPPLWSLFLMRHVRSASRPPSRAGVIVFVLVVALLWAAAWSNGLHGRFYGPGTHLGPPVLGLPRMHYDRGPLFYLSAAWAYAWMVAALLALGQAWHQARGRERRQWAAFLLMMSVPLAANLAYLGLGWRLAGGDPTPLSYAVALAGFALLIARGELFRVLPLARQLLFNELPDPVLVLDRHGHVVEANRAAEQLAGGRPPGTRALAEWPGFGAALAAQLAAPPGSAPALLQLSRPERFFEVGSRSIGPADAPIGRLLQLRNVSEHHRNQARLVHTLAERNAQLQQVAALQAELRDQALRDPLTGLHNRRALEQRFAAGLAQPLALAVIDVDHFKQINDRGGHAAGDEVLRALGALLQQGLRRGDAVYRTGGEEFVLLLPGADGAGALQRLERLRQATAEATLPGAPGPVTLSAGVAEAGQQGDTLDELLAAADAALYRAKAAGRNRVFIAG